MDAESTLRTHTKCNWKLKLDWIQEDQTNLLFLPQVFQLIAARKRQWLWLVSVRGGIYGRKNHEPLSVAGSAELVMVNSQVADMCSGRNHGRETMGHRRGSLWGRIYVRPGETFRDNRRLIAD
jgi:hypothetical protein